MMIELVLEERKILNVPSIMEHHSRGFKVKVCNHCCQEAKKVLLRSGRTSGIVDTFIEARIT